jgi:stearoyl-CoA desaturase (delta-9 desaturase)
VKSLWFITHALVAVIGGYLTFRYDADLLAFIFTVTTLCLGHSIGLHRLLVHRSFECPRWLECVFVHLGTVVGMGGPFRILYMHDIRDWSQRHESCHRYFIHQNPLWRDYLWQIHCDLRLDHPPKFEIEPCVATNRMYQFMERTWMLQQLPWAILFYALGGMAFVVWGISVRITISLLGHWLVGYFAHNAGPRDWYVSGHAIQGHNVPHIGLLTMGERGTTTIMRSPVPPSSACVPRSTTPVGGHFACFAPWASSGTSSCRRTFPRGRSLPHST